MPPLFDTLWWRREVDRHQAFSEECEFLFELLQGIADSELRNAHRRAIRNENDALSVGVGLNFGVCEVGNIAKGASKDLTAVGDVVNTTARLQANAQECEIVLSEAVYAVVADQVPEAKQTLIDLKGKAEHVKAFVIPADI